MKLAGNRSILIMSFAGLLKHFVERLCLQYKSNYKPFTNSMIHIYLVTYRRNCRSKVKITAKTETFSIH